MRFPVFPEVAPRPATARRLVRVLVSVLAVAALGAGGAAVAEAAPDRPSPPLLPSLDDRIEAPHRLSSLAAGGSQREVVINLPAFRLYLYENGRPVHAYPIGIGQAVRPTVLGTTRVINRVVAPVYYPIDWWRRGLKPIPPGPDNPVGTRWIGLGVPRYGIHGTNAPETIGTLASLGCIRMYNEDVEELFELVNIGTPVRILYETVVPWRDRSGDPWIRVYPDIYGRGTNTLSAALEKLSQAGLDPAQLFLPALRERLSRPDGRTRPVALQVPVFFEGFPAPPGYRVQGRLFLPAEALARAAGASVRWERDTLYVAGVPMGEIERYPEGAYAPAGSLVKALGLWARIDPDGLRLSRSAGGLGPSSTESPRGGEGGAAAALSPGHPTKGVWPGPVVVYHTYATMNYTPKLAYSPDGRPGDVVAVGETLVRALWDQGVQAVHLSNVYDFPDYALGPQQAKESLQALLAGQEVAALVDVRRDATARDWGKAYMTAHAEGNPVAKVLLLVGSLDNPRAQSNAAFAQVVHEGLEALAPGTSRGVRVLERRYHGDLHPRSLVVLIGAYGYTTMPEAQAAANLLARALASALTAPLE